MTVRRSWLFFVFEGLILAFLLLGKFLNPSAGSDIAGRVALGTFELGATAVSLLLLSRGRSGNASFFDWAVGALAVLSAAIGLAAYSSTLFALYLIVRDRSDQQTKAAGTVVLAATVQAVWAPLIFSKLSFLFLAIDAQLVGWLLAYVVPGASSGGTIVTTPSGHDVIITAACASFHNLSLASLSWVTLTMLHRPYWIKSDLYVGLGALSIQFALNLWRLVFVCMSPQMYEFWHEGLGKHIFSAVATAVAILFVQLFLDRIDRAAYGQRSGILAAR
jgi:exosortase/archaeosortase family protein